MKDVVFVGFMGAFVIVDKFVKPCDDIYFKIMMLPNGEYDEISVDYLKHLMAMNYCFAIKGEILNEDKYRFSREGW